MTIKTLPCTDCAHTDVCSYKEKYIRHITEFYPAVPPCDLYQKDGKHMVIKPLYCDMRGPISGVRYGF